LAIVAGRFFMDRDLVFYQFSRSKIERGDFSHFLGLHALDKLPTGRRLREMMDTMVFCIEGYDADSREIHVIPEVRRIYSAFHNAWPYWFYFCNLDVETLQAMVLCCLPSITAMKVDGSESVAITYDPLDLVNFLRTDFCHMNVIYDRAEIFEERIVQRTQAIFQYFGLPVGQLSQA